MTDPVEPIRRALARSGREEALRVAEALAARRPDDAGIARFVAVLRTERGGAAAEESWRRVLAIVPDDAEALYALGTLAGDRGDFDAAVAHLRAALLRAPGHPQIASQLGLALEETGHLIEAEAHFRQALQVARDPGYNAYANLARNLFRQRRYRDALPHFEALAQRFGIQQPLLEVAYAACLSHMARDAEAEAAYRRALARDPTAHEARRDYAGFLRRMRRPAAAAEILDADEVRERGDLLATSIALACRRELADWRDFGALRDSVVAGVAAGCQGPDAVAPPFDFLAICDDPTLQRVAAQSWARDEARASAPDKPRSRPARGKLRLGFVSSDYRDHPVGRLVVALFERIDRSRFEVAAYATEDAGIDPLRARVERAVDRYRPLDRRDVAACAAALAADDIDVLFDLNGYTGREAIQIFSRRPARVQVNFLGYTGTMAAPAYDFIVADRYSIPPELRDAYSERVLAIEPCYIPSDPTRTPEPSTGGRAAYGLPDDAFVFCSFSAVYKILPDVFDRWLGLLLQTPDSVLWLRDMPDETLARLRDEAGRRGVAAARLIAAPRAPIGRYLARFRLADLFLDSVPFGSHTTVNDALFMGLPVVTVAGRSFAGRASASQIVTAGCPDLVARDLDAYAALAGDLACDRARLDAITRRLREAGPRSPLFDMDAYARAFESAVENASRA